MVTYAITTYRLVDNGYANRYSGWHNGWQPECQPLFRLPFNLKWQFQVARHCQAMSGRTKVDKPTRLASTARSASLYRAVTFQVWDLRNAVSPQRTLTCHTKGVLSVAWCPSDTSLLLSCGKDNRTLCWDTNAGEVVAEIPASSNWNFDVQWSPRTPGILGAASFDGKVTKDPPKDPQRALPEDLHPLRPPARPRPKVAKASGSERIPAGTFDQGAGGTFPPDFD
eukprot:5584713-Pyramimonas_sp.AAC.1